MKKVKLKVMVNVIIFVVISIISTFIQMYFDKNTFSPILCIGIGLWTCGLYFGWFYIFLEKFRMVGIVLLCIFFGLPISTLMWVSIYNSTKPDITLNFGWIIINSIIYCSMFLSAGYYARLYNEQHLKLEIEKDLELS